MATAVDEATELLQQLIRNRCVNDGTPVSGGEIRKGVRKLLNQWELMILKGGT
jgi:hypothetical protein